MLSIKSLKILFFFYAFAIIVSPLSYATNNDKPAIPGHPKIYKGIVKPITVAQVFYSFDENVPGIIVATAATGAVIHGPILSTDGSIIKEGGLLCKFSDSRRKNIVKERKYLEEISKANLECAKKDYNRYIYLSKVRASPVQAHEHHTSKYLQALSDYYNRQLSVKRATNWVKAMTRRAQFDCVVTKIFQPFGYCNYEAVILEHARLNPIGIKIKMSREHIYKINAALQISAYPAGSNNPVSLFAHDRICVKDGLILKVSNRPLQIHEYLNEKKENIKILPIIHSFDPVEIMDSMISVPEKSIHKDKKGYYVWKASPSTDPKEEKHCIFTVNKIYITPDDKLKPIASHITYRYLKSAKT